MVQGKELVVKYEITLEQVEAMNKSTYKDLVKNKVKKGGTSKSDRAV